MKTILKALSLVAALLTLFGIAFATRQWKETNVRKVSAPVLEKEDEPVVPDPALVEKFIRISSVMSNRQQADFSGSITIIDGADSSQNIIRSPYQFYQNGTDMYYAVNQCETFCHGDEYTYLDHVQKKIMIGKINGVQTQNPLQDIQKVIANISSERYKLTDREISGTLRKISLINPLHISCRAYEITYEASSLEIRQIEVQMDNLNNPFDTRLDKRICYTFQHSQPKERRSYTVKHFVEKKSNGEWVARVPYQNYEVISTL
jgi:hypothetical protein